MKLQRDCKQVDRGTATAASDDGFMLEHTAAAPTFAVVRLDDAMVDRGLTDLRSSAARVLSSGGSVLVVDVSGVERLTSTVVSALLWVRRICAARQVRLVLNGLSDQHVDVLRRTGLAAALDSRLDRSLDRSLQ
jgi:ABC-type transporter Mla MlaB component